MVANRLGTSQRGRGEKIGGPPTAATAERRSSARIQKKEGRRRSALGAVSEGEDEGEEPISEDENEPSNAAVETTKEHQEIKNKEVEAEIKTTVKEEEIDENPITLSPGIKDEMRKRWGEHAKAQEQSLRFEPG